MLDIAVIAVLSWLLIVHCMLRVSHSKHRWLLNAALSRVRAKVSSDTGQLNKNLIVAEPRLLKLSGRADVSISHAGHAIFISAVCLGALTLLTVLHREYGIPSAGWMSALLLPAPACMWVLPSLDWFRRGVGGRPLNVASGLAASIRHPVSVNSLVLVIPILLAIQVATQLTTNPNVRSIDANDASAGIGMFTVISGLFVIIAGGIALRLLYVDKAYRELTKAMNETRIDGTGRSGQAPRWQGGRFIGESAFRAQTAHPQAKSTKELSDVSSKRASNGRGALIDGICMTMISIVGLATALEYSPGLLVSATVSFACFLCAVMPLHYHVRSALSLREPYHL